MKCCSLTTIIISVLVITVVMMTSLQIYMFYKFNFVPADSPRSIELTKVTQVLGHAVDEARRIEPAHLMNIFAPSKIIGHDTNQGVLRVACIVIYEGPTLPSWFDSFAFSAQFTSSLVDWYIFVTDLPRHDFPPNVKIIRITNDDLYARIAKALTADDPEGRGGNTGSNLRGDVDGEFDLKYSLQILLEDQPYMLVELKPVLGVIFEDYLTEYSHWGYADIDTVLGNMQLHLTPRMLRKYDVYTVSFGDTYRYYMRGQITIHKNDPYVNNIWRSCSSLSTLVDRLKTYMVQRRKAKAEGKNAGKSVQWRFVSAEGCYSKAVAIHKNVSVLVSPGQLSDAFSGSTVQREVFQIEDRLMRCFMHPVQPNTTRADNALVLTEAGHRKEEWVPLEVTTKNCAYWVAPEFQVCLSFVPAGVEMRAENGIYEYNEQNFQYYVGGKSNCRLGFISHFQGWKNNYYKFTTRTPSLDNTNSILYSSTGFIPLRLDIPTLSVYGEITGTSLPFGRIAPLDIALGVAAAAGAGEEGEGEVGWSGGGRRVPRLMGSGSTADARGQVDGDGLVTQYCAGFTSNLKRCCCPLLGSHIEFFGAHASLGSPLLTVPSEEQTSLITVAWAEDYYDGRLEGFLKSWPLGPVVVVLAKLSGEDQFDRRARFKSASGNSGYVGGITVIEVNLGGCVDHLKKPTSEPADKGGTGYILPENVLYNIGMDVASTDLICIVPPAVSVQQQQQLFNFSFSIGGKATEDTLETAELLSELTGQRALIIPFDAPAAGSDSDTGAAGGAVGAVGAIGSGGSPVGNQGKCVSAHPEWLKSEVSFLQTHQHNIARDVSYNDLSVDGGIFGKFFDKSTQLQPVLFNKRWSEHGAEFVRFPEELDGSQCHGHVVYAVLGASGHVLSVSTLISLHSNSDSGSGSLVNVNDGGGGDAGQACGCLHGAMQPAGRGDKKKQRHARHLFLENLRGYLQRTTEIRASKFRKEFSPEPHGYLFEHEQLELKERT